MVMPDDVGGDQNDAWRRRSKFLHSDRVSLLEALREELDTEGCRDYRRSSARRRVRFDASLSECLLSRHG